jgi:hypothetical protein
MIDNARLEGPEKTCNTRTAEWTAPRQQIIPRATYSPAVMALAIVCLLWGFLTSYLISLLGLILFVVALAGWIGELRHERQ